MRLLWICVVNLTPFLSLVTGTTFDRCLSIPEVDPKKYFHFYGKSLNITIEVSGRITHQLTTHVFYIFIKEVLGYDKVNISLYEDNFQIDRVFERLSDASSVTPEAMINLEVWLPPDYDTYATEFVKECGSAEPPGRFGWFVPARMAAALMRDQRYGDDVRTIHWSLFRDRERAGLFDVGADFGRLLDEWAMEDSETRRYICNDTFCNNGTYIPEQCKGRTCALLLSSNFEATRFVIEHIEEQKLLVKVIWLGDNLARAVENISAFYQGRKDKSLVILSWTPSDMVLHERDFLSVSFENCENMNFTRYYTCRYEMHRLVKLAWSKVERFATPLYDALRTFRFEEDDYSYLLDLYERNPQRPVHDLACDWMKSRNKTWQIWTKSKDTTIYIGGIFPLSESSYEGAGIVKAAKMASDAINQNSTILPNYNLQLIATDGMCQADNVMKQFIDFIVEGYYSKLVGVLGPACSDTVEPLAGVSRHYRIMVVSYSAEGASFSNREKYPYFFRTIGENRHYCHVYRKFFQSNGWKRVAALTEDGQKYTEYISFMQNDLESNNIAFIANKKFPREREAESMRRYLEDLKNKRARIIIADVIDEIARNVVCEALKLEMTAAHGYVWFFPVWLNKTWYDSDYFNAFKDENVNCTTAELFKAATGYFSLTYAYWARDDAVMQENITVGKWRTKYEENMLQTRKRPSDYAGFAYDAVWTYALALDKLSRTDPEAVSDLHSENTTNKLVRLVEQTDFYGVSGRIKFRGGPSRFSVIHIMQWYNNETHLVAEFYPNLTDDKPEINGGELKLHNIKWFTLDGSKPDDGTLPNTCAVQTMAEFFGAPCQDVYIGLIISIAGTVILAMLAIGFFFKRRYDKKMDVVKHQSAAINKLLRVDLLFETNLEGWELEREKIMLNRKLGEGGFGTVYGGEADIRGEWMAVAVKTLKLGSCKEDRVDFLYEAECLRRFDHQNIVRLLGVCTSKEPVLMVMEFMLYGDLKTFLLARRYLAGKSTEESEEVSPVKLTTMALDVARGLSYLAEMKYVHRDLACRNCLLNAQRVVKIGDFGMTRQTYDNDCYRFSRKGMMPVRWMSPESLIFGVFTPASDVWSYGVLLFEIITFGSLPFQGKTNAEVLEEVKQGATVAMPMGVKPQLEGLIRSCWKRDPAKRPEASHIVEFMANHPKLLVPCLDTPLTAITFDNSKELEAVPTNLSALNSPDVHKPMCNGNSTFKLPPPLPPDLGIPLERYGVKQPLLGNGRVKSSSSLASLGRLVSAKREDGDEEENVAMVENGPPNELMSNTIV